MFDYYYETYKLSGLRIEMYVKFDNMIFNFVRNKEFPNFVTLYFFKDKEYKQPTKSKFYDNENDLPKKYHHIYKFCEEKELEVRDLIHTQQILLDIEENTWIRYSKDLTILEMNCNKNPLFAKRS